MCITVGDYPEGIAATADAQRIVVAKLAVVDEVQVGNGPRAFGAFLRR
jgi:hypothetical protein